MHLRAFPFLIAIACCLIGCDRDARFHGKWKFDREYTESHLPKDEQTPPKGDGLQTMKNQLASMLVPTLIEKLAGSHLTITRKEMIFVMNDGTGKAQAYEILERPAQDSWRIKTADGKVQTYSREGERLYSPASGDVHFKAYFQAEK